MARLLTNSSLLQVIILFQLIITVITQLPSISEYHILPIDPVLKEGIVGIPYEQAFSMNPSTLNLSSVVFIAASVLPEGLRLQNSTIIGTPVLTGNYSIHIQVQIPSIMIQIDANFSLNIKTAEIINSSIPSIKLSVPFSLSFAARGGIPPLIWSFQQLPSWASSNNSTITGTPTSFGGFPFKLKLADSRNNTLTQDYTLIVQNQGPVIFKISPNQITVTSNVLYSVLLTPSGGSPPYILQYPNKPSWLSAAQNVVQIFVQEMGQYYFPILIIDFKGSFQTITIKVNSVNEQAGLIDYINKATTNITDPRTGIKMTIFNNNWMNDISQTLSLPPATTKSSSSNTQTPSNSNINNLTLANSFIKTRSTNNDSKTPCPLQPNTQTLIGRIKQVKYGQSVIILSNNMTLKLLNCTKQQFKSTSDQFKAGDSIAFAGNSKKQNQWFVYSISNLS